MASEAEKVHEKLVMVTVLVEESLKDAFSAKCEKKDVRMSQVLRMKMREYVEEK